MACILTASIALGCRENVGGIKRIYITELENKATLTATAGVITAFTLSTGKKFWTYDFDKETGEPTEKPTPSSENGTLFYEQELAIKLNRVEATKRNELFLVAKNRCMIIFLDRNGKYWLFGETNGMDLAPSETKWGKAMGDHNGYNLIFMGKEEAPAQEVTGSLIADLIVAAS